MVYSQDLTNSARRHLAAAERLDDPNSQRHRHRHVAGYLYGVAAECALKQIMRESGIPRLTTEQRRDDPYFAHFPVLKTMLLDRIQGRRSADLRRYAEDSALMNEWNTDMRYAPGSDIQHRHVDRWRVQARELVNAMEAM